MCWLHGVARAHPRAAPVLFESHRMLQLLRYTVFPHDLTGGGEQAVGAHLPLSRRAPASTSEAEAEALLTSTTRGAEVRGAARGGPNTSHDSLPTCSISGHQGGAQYYGHTTLQMDLPVTCK
jgi:hypothetical protein